MLKIRLDGLCVGMYISKLDRPWVDLPINMEGILVQSGEDIDFIKKYCNHVYIDTSKGSSASPVYWVSDEKKQGSEQLHKYYDEAANKFTLVNKEEYEITSTLQEEYSVASDIHKDITQKITQTYDDLQQNNKFSVDSLKESVSKTVSSIIRNPIAFQFVMQLKKVDNYSYNHALATSVWCAQLGRTMGFDIESLNHLCLGGLLLDIGKTKIPWTLLTKKGSLTEAEIILLRSHVDHGIKLLIEHQDIPHEVIRMVATHHERADGSGYPLALKGDEIPVFGHIAGLIDSFDAMTSARPFEPRVLAPHDAISKLYSQRNKEFKTELMELFIQTVGLYPNGTLVELESGEVAVVVKINGLKRLRPTIMIITDKNKKPISDFISVDLSKPSDYKIKHDLAAGAYGIQMDNLFL